MLDSERKSLAARLRSAEGHLRSVIRMMEEDCDPERVLHQMSAVQGAVQRLKREFLLQCVCDSLESLEKEDCPEKFISEVDRIHDLYRLHS